MWRPSQLINAAVLISQFRCEDAYIPRVAFLGDISRQARVKVISFFALEPARSARSDGLGVYTVHSQVVLWTKFLNACASRAGCVRGCDRRTAMIVAHTISSLGASGRLRYSRHCITRGGGCCQTDPYIYIAMAGGLHVRP